MQVTLERVWRGDQETKFGIRNKVNIKTKEHGDRWISALFDPTKGKSGTEDWVEGNKVNIFITENGDYLNYSLKESDASKAYEKEQELARREKELEEREKALSGGKIDKHIEQTDVPDIELDDIPF